MGPVVIALDISGGESFKENYEIIGWTVNNQKNQKFRFKLIDDKCVYGVYATNNNGNSFYIGHKKGSLELVKPLGDAVNWIIYDTGNSTFMFKANNVNSTYLTVDSKDKPIYLAPYDESSLVQHWQMLPHN